jgi:hypothetical protein
VLSEEALAAILERRERDSLGEQPAPEELSAAFLPPETTDKGFLLRRLFGCRSREQLDEALHTALLDLLASDIPLTEYGRQAIAHWLRLLRRGQKPLPHFGLDTAGRRKALTFVMSIDLDVATAEKEREGVKAPARAAAEAVAEHWGMVTEPFLSSLQPSRQPKSNPDKKGE